MQGLWKRLRMRSPRPVASPPRLGGATRSATLYSALCDAMARQGRGYRVLEDMRRVEYRYQDLLKMVLMLTRLVERAAPLSEAGSSIGLLLPNVAPTVALIFGLSARGRTPAMLNYTAGADALIAACRMAQLQTVISSRTFEEQAQLGERIKALREAGSVRVLYLEDLRAAIGVVDKLWLMAWALWRPRQFELADAADSERPAVLLFTSGSEDKPKGVVLPHRALLANLAQIHAVIELGAQDKILSALPVFHCFGLTAGALLPLLGGTRLFLYTSPLHYRVIPELAYERACTVLFGTSTFLGHYARHAQPHEFCHLRYVIAGAERLNEGVRQLWQEKFGLQIFEGYGATEAAPVLSVNTPAAHRTGSVGRFLPLIEWRLSAIEGISRGGRLHVRGPNVMSGYLRHDRPGEVHPVSSSEGDGWYDTGDIAEVDADGFVFLLGRVKRFAKVAGEMVSLEMVELLAQACSPAASHAASMRADAARGELLVLFTTDASLSREALQRKARELGYAELVVPRKVVMLESLPLLGSGKLDYVTLRGMAEEV